MHREVKAPQAPLTSLGVLLRESLTLVIHYHEEVHTDEPLVRLAKLTYTERGKIPKVHLVTWAGEVLSDEDLARVYVAFDDSRMSDNGVFRWTEPMEDLVAYIRDSSTSQLPSVKPVLTMIDRIPVVMRTAPDHVFSLTDFNYLKGRARAEELHFAINELLARGLIEQVEWRDKRGFRRAGYVLSRSN